MDVLPPALLSLTLTAIQQSTPISATSAETLLENPQSSVMMAIDQMVRDVPLTVFPFSPPGSAQEEPLQQLTPARLRIWMESWLDRKLVMTETRMTLTDVRTRAPSMLATPVLALLLFVSTPVGTESRTRPRDVTMATRITMTGVPPLAPSSTDTHVQPPLLMFALDSVEME